MKIITLVLGPVSANCYILIDDNTREAVVIDPGDYNDRLVDTIEKNDISKVKYIMLTHGHFDHILGVSRLKEKTGAKVLIHSCDEKCLKDEDESLACDGGVTISPCDADILIKNGDLFRFGNTEFTVMHTPGHTKGGVCYIFEKERVIFSGDTLFCITCGRTDFKGGSAEEMTLSLMKLKSLIGDYTVYPGHNRPTTLEKERKSNRFMRKL